MARFEVGCARIVSVNGDRERVHEADLERCGIFADGESQRLSGAAARASAFGVALARPVFAASTAQTLDCLRTLAAPFAGRAELHYSAMTLQRQTVGDVPPAPPRALTVWAVAGWLTVGGARARIPVGWSGRGDGLGWLADGAAATLRGLASRVEGAAAMERGAPAVVLSPAAAAVVIHEAVGHLAEAQVHASQRRSVVGLRIASELISIVDDPAHADGPATYRYDDDNVCALAPTPLVHEGALVGQLHSSASARACRLLPTANARAATVWDEPIPRISNLVCKPGDTRADEIVASMRDGLYVHQLADGIHSAGHIEARIILAERIRRGALTGELLTGGRLSDRVDLLRRVAAVGDDARFHVNALCGRFGQLLFDVGTKAPSLRLERVEIAA